MFRFVSAEQYETEKTLRVQAEARVSVLESQNAELLRMLETERTRHAAERTDLLDRIVPKIEAAQAGDGKSMPFTSQQVWRMPAYGKTDMQRRNTEARQLEREEMSEDERVAWDKRYAQLSDEERASLSTGEDEALSGMLNRVYEPKIEGPKQEEAV